MISKKIVAALIVALIASQSSFVYALEKEWKAEELSEDQQKAFITRDEFTSWVTAFTASLSEVDKNATQKIFDNMDFYDLQYKITIVYALNENTGDWHSQGGIKRSEGTYFSPQGDAATNKTALDNFTADATAWEKHRRGLQDNPPSEGTWQAFWDKQADASNPRGYHFTKEGSYDPNYKY